MRGTTIRPTSGTTGWLELRWLPVRILVYAVGISALHTCNYKVLAAALLRKIIGSTGSEEILAVMSSRSQLDEVVGDLHRFKGKRTPLSDLLFEVVQPLAIETIGSDLSVESAFDRWEYFLGLVEFHKSTIRGFLGRYHWKYRRDPLPARFRKEVEAQGTAWQALSTGFFDGSLQQYQQTADRFQERLDRVHWF